MTVLFIIFGVLLIMSGFSFLFTPLLTFLSYGYFIVILVLVLGLFCYYIVTLIINPLIKSVTPSEAGTVIRCFIQMFCIVFLFPLIFVLIEKKQKKVVD